MGDDHAPSLERALGTPFYPALGVGAATGALGVAYGGIASILIQSPRPTIYTTLTGVQWFCGGTTFFYCRNALLSGPLSRDRGIDRVAASGLAGSCAGAVAASFLPRGSIVPGSIMLGVIAAASQAGLNTMGDSSPGPDLSSRLKQRLASLVPMKSLTDDEYERLLQDKLLKLEVEISILDDQIANLRAASKQQTETENASSTNPTR